MRILHVITSLRTGGAEKLMVDLLPKLRDLGNEVELLLFDGVRTPFYEELESKGIRIYFARVEGSVYDPRNVQFLRGIMNNYDIVHTHNTSPQLFAAIAKSIKVGSSVKLVTTEHNTTNRRRNKTILKPVDRWMYHQYERVICISEQAEINLRKYLNDNSSKICTVFNGIDFSSFADQNTAKKIMDKEEGVHVVTMVAAFREQKDQQTLISSFSLLPDNYKLQFVGTGDQELINKAHNLVEELNLSSRVDFLGMRTDIPDILHSTDIVVLSSHYEGLSLSSLEGMASGKPFVASDVDGLHEIVNGYGLLFPHEDSHALADIIIKLSEDKVFAEQVANKCQERAKQFDINVMAEKYMDIYKQL